MSEVRDKPSNPIAKALDEPAYAINPAGVAVKLTPKQVSETQRGGYEHGITKDQAEGLTKSFGDINYVDQNWGTAGKVAMGAADGATMGLGPALATKLGMLDAGHLEAAQQSGAYTAGEVGGFLAPALLSGGESVIGRALAATPAGALGRVGGAVEGAIGRLLPEAGILGKTGAKAVSAAARGASEGALMNVAHEASQEIIHNAPLSAQALLATGLDGAMFGGAMGFGLGAVGSLVSRGAEGIATRGVGAASGMAGERAAGVALKRLGQTAEDFATKEGGAVGAVRAYSDLMEKGGTSFAAPTSHIRKAMTEVSADLGQTAKSAIKELGEVSQPGIVPLKNLVGGLDQEYAVLYRNTAARAEAAGVYRELKSSLAGKENAMTTWEQWATNRDIISARAASAPEGTLRKTIYESALTKFDAEFRAAGTAANEEVFQKYAAATAQKAVADSLVESTGTKLGTDAAKGNPLQLNQSDGGALGIGAVLGNPVGAVGIVAARKITAHIQDKLEPLIAEYAARSAIGAKAGAATAHVGERLTGALRKMMLGGTKAVGNYRAETKATEGQRPKLSYTMKAYDEARDLAERYTSDAHQSRVREYMGELEKMGHPDLAKEFGMAYGRSVAYLNANKQKGVLKDKAPGSLQKLPNQVQMNDKAWRFMRQFHSMRDPLGTLVEGLEKGNLSRDSVAAIRYVMPDLHSELVSRAAQVAMEMKAEGKYLPADKLSLLGCALGHPVDSKLTKEFIDEVQQGLAANRKPPAPNDSPPPVTDTTSYQTPLQTA